MKAKFVCLVVMFFAISILFVSCDNHAGGSPSRSPSSGSGSAPSGTGGGGSSSGGSGGGSSSGGQPSYESIVAGEYSYGSVSYIFNKKGTGTKSTSSGNIRAIADDAFTWKVNNKSGKTYTATITQGNNTETATFDTSGTKYTVTIADVTYTKDSSTNDGGDTPPHEHDFSIEVAGGRNPTCTENGTKKLKCTGCDETVDRDVPALGHKPSVNFVKATGDEKNHHKYCSICGEEVASAAHLFTGGKCSVCGYENGSNPPSGGGSTPESTPVDIGGGMKRLFAPGVTTDGGWHDANKTPKGYNDFVEQNLCWAATSSNVITWWQDRYNDLNPTQKINLSLPQTAQDVFQIFKNYWSDNTHGGFGDGIPWYFVGGTKSDKIQSDGGFLSDYTSANRWIPSFNATAYKAKQNFSSLADFSATVIDGLKKGAIAFGIVKNNAGYGHAITLWGVEYDSSTNIVKKVYVTDSDVINGNSLESYEISYGTYVTIIGHPYGYDRVAHILILYAP